MLKKILIIFCIVLLITSIMQVNAINSDKEKISQGKNVCNYNWINLNEGNSYNYPTMIEYFDLSDSHCDLKPEIVETPDYFSWADYRGENWLTPVKKQLCGDCWDFAALGTLESIIKIRENCSEINPDLSEQYVLSCISGAGSCNGGSSYLALKILKEISNRGNNHNGVILESCFSYQGSDDIPCDEKCSDWEEKLIPILEFGQWMPSRSKKGIEEIKSFIMKNGPVVAHIDATNYFKYWGSYYNSPDDYFPYIGPKIMINHVVVLLGWKDDPRVSNGGYWICKNSWGVDWGYNGYFNIEFNSLNIDNAPIVWVDYDPDSYDWDPVASAGEKHIVETDEEILFDGSNSTDAESDLTSYIWNFGDGIQSNDIVTRHSYSEPGIYEVTLTVVDSNNNTDTDETYVWVEREANPPSKPVIKGIDNVKLNKEYSYTISSSDPDNDDIFYLIESDAYIESDKWIGPYGSGVEIMINKSWNFFSNHQIKVKAKDIYGLESEWGIIDVDIENALIGKLLLLKDIFFDIVDSFLLKT